MNDLIPLKLLQSEGLAASVLRSADDDEAPPHAVKKVAAALGVQASVLVLSSTSSASAVAVAASSAGIAGVSKALLIGIGAGVLVSGSVMISDLAGTKDQPTRAPAVRSAPIAPRPVEPTRTELPPVASAAEPAPEVVEPRRAPALPPPPVARSSQLAEPPPLTAAETPAVASAAPKTPPSVAEEVAELDRARALVATGQPIGALAVLDGYAKRFPGGVLALEAAVLRVEAELARGNRAEAERQGRALMTSHPSTGYARKVARLLGYE